MDIITWEFPFRHVHRFTM